MTVTSPVNYAGIRKALHAAIQSAVGLDANSVAQMQAIEPGAVRPGTPYAAWMLTGIGAPNGRDARVDPDEQGRYAFVGQRVVTAQFQFFGRSIDEAFGMASAWVAGLYRWDIEDLLLEIADLAVWSVDGPQNLTALASTGFEARAAVNATFGIASVSWATVNRIHTVPVSGGPVELTVSIPPDASEGSHDIH